MPACLSKHVLLESMQLAKQQLYQSNQRCMRNCLVMHLTHRAGPDLAKANCRRDSSLCWATLLLVCRCGERACGPEQRDIWLYTCYFGTSIWLIYCSWQCLFHRRVRSNLQAPAVSMAAWALQAWPIFLGSPESAGRQHKMKHVSSICYCEQFQPSLVVYTYYAMWGAAARVYLLSVVDWQAFCYYLYLPVWP